MRNNNFGNIFGSGTSGTHNFVTSAELDFVADYAAKRAAQMDRALAIKQQKREESQQKNNTNSNQSGGAVASSASTIQLQKELDEALKKIAIISSQLQQEKQKSKEKDDFIAASAILMSQLQQQLAHAGTVSPSPFVADKPYHIDLAINGVKVPSDPNAFGKILSGASSSSQLFLEAKRLFRDAAGFSLEQVDVIYTPVSAFEIRMKRLQNLPLPDSFSSEKLQLLFALERMFLPRTSNNADAKSPNLINVFHGTRQHLLPGQVQGLHASRSGPFGNGVSVTTSIEFASRAARCNPLDEADFADPRADGCFPVLWCVAAVGACYPVSKDVDFSQKRKDDDDDEEVSDFFNSQIQDGFDCHVVPVDEKMKIVSRKEMKYMKMIFEQEVQVLPIAVLWVKPN
jgi:hypothetical protein